MIKVKSIEKTDINTFIPSNTTAYSTASPAIFYIMHLFGTIILKKCNFLLNYCRHMKEIFTWHRLQKSTIVKV